jgi:hypothetical protein
MFEQGGVVTEVPAFRIEISPGKFIDLRSEVSTIMRADAAALNNSFDKVAADWIGQINKLVANAAGSKDTFVLAYERNAAGMAVLWIERFECLDFEFRVQNFFTRNNAAGRSDLQHTPKGSSYVLQQSQVSVNIPPFDCSRIAKCDPVRPVEQFCKQVDMQLEIKAGVAGGAINVSVANVVGSDAPVEFLWEVQDCTLPFANGKSASFTIAQRSPPVKQVRLTAFTKNGCMVTARTQVQVTTG